MVPCAQCCECEIGSDTFDGDLSNWTQDSGSWSTSSGLLTHSGAGEITLNAAAGGPGASAILETNPQTASGTAVSRYKISKEDADNYLFGELSYSGGGGTIRVGQVRNGVQKWLSDAVTITPVSRPDIQLCWIPGASQESTTGTYSADAGEGSSTGFWNDTNFITLEDGNNATWTFSAIGEVTDELRAGLFGADAIPTGSTINDIAVGLKATSGDMDHEVTVEAIELVFGNHTPAGGSLTFGDAVPFAPGVLSRSVSPAAWGFADIISEDLADGNFAILSYFQVGVDPDPPNSSPMGVDIVQFEATYTTPPRGPGRLSFKYGSETVCARAFGVHGTGTKAAIEVVSGTWDWEDFTYSYHQSASRPDCPFCDCTEDAICTDCCAEGFEPAAEYVLDLSGFALDFGPDDLAGCDCGVIDGFVSVIADGVCRWTASGVADCFTLGVPTRRPWSVTLVLVSDGMGGCIWRATIIGPAHTGTVFGGSIPQLRAVYESTSIDDESCQTMPATLSKVLEFIGSSCSGTLPATIPLDLP